MHLHFNGVNEAFHGLVRGFKNGTTPTKKNHTRNGPVIRATKPMTISYSKPWQRVLLNRARDANPFFHLFESLWMLAGKDDVASIAKYANNISQYSDNGKNFWGAYGYRWRNHFGYDQLQMIIDELKRDSQSRRCVLSVWDGDNCIGRSDLHKAIDGGKDLPCNTHVYFEIEEYFDHSCITEDLDNRTSEVVRKKRLNMTVCNRSNDLIWGLAGANAVHFSMLLEYMAACIGVDIGAYNQFTNNLHVYTENNSGWKPEYWLNEYNRTMHSLPPLDYKQFEHLMPLVHSPEVFDEEIQEFVKNDDWTRNWKEPFLQDVAAPMCWAFELHKRREYRYAKNIMMQVKADDWRIMGLLWIEKRETQYARKQNEKASTE